MSFAQQRLDDVCEIIMGQAPSGGAYNAEGNGWPLIAGAGDFGEIYPDSNRAASSKYTLFALSIGCKLPRWWKSMVPERANCVYGIYALT